MSRDTVNRPGHSAPIMVGGAEALHLLLTRHQPPDLFQRLHHKKWPHCHPRPDPVDLGHDRKTTDGRR